jgi:hypothetical protein
MLSNAGFRPLILAFKCIFPIIETWFPMQVTDNLNLQFLQLFPAAFSCSFFPQLFLEAFSAGFIEKLNQYTYNNNNQLENIQRKEQYDGLECDIMNVLKDFASVQIQNKQQIKTRVLIEKAKAQHTLSETEAETRRKTRNKVDRHLQRQDNKHVLNALNRYRFRRHLQRQNIKRKSKGENKQLLVDKEQGRQ